MANHELYIGGPPTSNSSQAMFPAPALDVDAAGFQVGPGAHKGPIGYNLTRLLDFSGADRALAEWARNATYVATDVLGVVLIPKNMLFLGFYYKVTKPIAGITLTPALRNGGVGFTAINGGVAAEGFVAPGGGAVITEGVVDLGAAFYSIQPDMLDLTLTALPAGKLSGFSMEISPVLLAVNTGGYR